MHQGGSNECPAGAKFRESIDMGFFEGSFQEAHRLAYSLSPDFEGGAYNLFSKYGPLG
jgi:hypothetical protein